MKKLKRVDGISFTNRELRRAGSASTGITAIGLLLLTIGLIARDVIDDRVQTCIACNDAAKEGFEGVYDICWDHKGPSTNEEEEAE